MMIGVKFRNVLQELQIHYCKNPTYIVENADRIISFALGEGNKPLGIFLDQDSEYLSFPSIFCGKRRPDNNKRKVPVSYGTIVKWKLRSKDRRAAMSVSNISNS